MAETRIWLAVENNQTKWNAKAFCQVRSVTFIGFVKELLAEYTNTHTTWRMKQFSSTWMKFENIVEFYFVVCSSLKLPSRIVHPNPVAFNGTLTIYNMCDYSMFTCTQQTIYFPSLIQLVAIASLYTLYTNAIKYFEPIFESALPAYWRFDYIIM